MINGCQLDGERSKRKEAGERKGKEGEGGRGITKTGLSVIQFGALGARA